jgi:fructose-bisphosphate aldolase class II
MKSLREIIKEAEKNQVAIGHFNVSDCVGLKAVFGAAKELNLPIIIGVSEGEREFIGVKRIADAVKSIREEFNYPIFLNADHTHSLGKIKEAVEAGFDAVMFDGSGLPLEENIKKTKEAVGFVKDANPEILIEAELGYIRGSSAILTDAAIQPEDLTKPEEAARFVKETEIDLLAPAVGNLHGIIARTNADLTQTNAENPPLDIERIRKIKEACSIPLVLHGGSGIKDEDFKAAIKAGISVIHINTELRLAWRRGLEKSFAASPQEIVPYKLLPGAVDEIRAVVAKKLKLFSGMSKV